jgi:hypothetical protein
MSSVALGRNAIMMTNDNKNAMTKRTTHLGIVVCVSVLANSASILSIVFNQNCKIIFIVLNMPELLSEMNNLSIVTPHVADVGVPRFSNPPQDGSYQNWTMIEDVMSCQTALPATTQLSYMPPYNSNGLIPAYHQAVCPNRAEQALINLTRNPLPPQQNIYVPPQQLFGQSYQQQVDQYHQQYPPYTTALPNPPFAGSVPNMKNAKAQDVAVPLVEGYTPPRQPSQSQTPKREKCMECLRHMDGCGLCQKLSQNSTRKHWAGIIILIIIIGCLVAYICYLKRRNYQGGALGADMLRGVTIDI